MGWLELSLKLWQRPSVDYLLSTTFSLTALHFHRCLSLSALQNTLYCFLWRYVPTVVFLGNKAVRRSTELYFWYIALGTPFHPFSFIPFFGSWISCNHFAPWGRGWWCYTLCWENYEVEKSEFLKEVKQQYKPWSFQSKGSFIGDKDSFYFM